ncbi:Cytochrome P450 [Nannocystis exedens]|uniref:Cytochrome P450 n=1 Tax=Nannocystis exedens TaxID=54 RepID=A0A1I1XKY9_9BACT|nr:cytochrome P450 [Nannocystis exedens]PCC73337.1 cytochrome [Nannocystis exedens]SFE07986.1 Cytochrome P450 [Nannocystis exedens]
MLDTTDLLTPAMFADPYPIYARLREQAPVLQVPQIGMWLVTRYDDVHQVLKAPDVFSSSRTKALDKLRDPRLTESMEMLASSSLVALDPPDHTRLRRLVNVAFTPRAIARLEARVRELARELVDAIARKDRFDLMDDLAIPLPVIVISELLGVDPARRAEFKRWSDDLILGSRLDGHLDDAEIDRIVASRREFVAFFHAMIEQRRRRPGDDLLSDLVRAEAERDALTPEEVLTMAVLLMVAGNETTTNLIGNGTVALLEHPDLLPRLRADPTRIPAFLEEVLRWRSPVVMLVRTTRRDVTLGGVDVPRDSVLGVLVDSANHDPTHFPEPERFDLERQPAHLSFGYGIHFCVGAPLSRLEGRIAFEELLARVPEFAREPGPLEWTPSFNLRGLRRLPLRRGGPLSAAATRGSTA